MQGQLFFTTQICQDTTGSMTKEKSEEERLDQLKKTRTIENWFGFSRGSHLTELKPFTTITRLPEKSEEKMKAQPAQSNPREIAKKILDLRQQGKEWPEIQRVIKRVTGKKLSPSTPTVVYLAREAEKARINV